MIARRAGWETESPLPPPHMSRLFLSLPRRSLQYSSTVKTEVSTTADVRRVPRLSGGAGTDVAEVLLQYWLVLCFRAKPAPTNDETYVDQHAFEYMSLTCDRAVWTLYQQLMDAQIDWRADVSPKRLLKSLVILSLRRLRPTVALSTLNLLIPANSIEDCALQLAKFKRIKDDTVAAHALRFRSVIFFHFYFPALLVGEVLPSTSFWTSRGHMCPPFSPPVRAFIFCRA